MTGVRQIGGSRDRAQRNWAKVARLVLPVVMVVVAATAAPQAVDQAAAAAKVQIRFWYYGDFVEVVEKLADDFEKANPDISVKVELQTQAPPVWDKWVVAAAGGTLPDASLANPGIPLLDAVQPIDELLTEFPNSGISQKEFIPGMWRANTFGGHIIGLPFRANSQIILYDADAFDQAGIASTPKTWDQFAATARKLTVNKDGVVQRYGFAFRVVAIERTPEQFGNFNGWQPFNEGFTRAYYNDPKYVQAVSFLRDMVRQGITGLPGPASDLAGGKTAMLNEGPWMLSGIRKANPKFRVEGFVPPRGPSGEQPYAWIGGENLVMFKTSKHKAETLKWMKYLAVDRNAEYNAATRSFFPVVANAGDLKEWMSSSIWRSVFEILSQGCFPATAGGQVPPVINTKIVPAYRNALNAIFGGSQEVEPALTEVQRLAEQALKG